MRVKRLEIQGFKSFKDKTVIHFDHTITGIVGPNGCGKSNIVDAFFWVMGEQSYKHMRSSGTSDLIFNGSSKYNPLGFAEVTLVLETDFVETDKEPAGASVKDLPVHLRSKEISVTRRVYRGGEGEYLVNNVHSRLRDIQELFMDTGVGAKGYSVIEQGQIDRVVNAKPDDRRKLIEEAAGIAKYKARKRESLRKMEQAQGNLSRLTDILQEIERNLRSLDRQAQRARKYKEYKEELLDKEVSWARRKKKIFEEQIAELNREKENLNIELTQLDSELQRAENFVETERVSQTTESKNIEELQGSIQEISARLTREQSSLELSQKRQEDLSQQITSFEEERVELLDSVKNEKDILEQRKSELETLSGSMEEFSLKVKALEAQVQSFRSEVETHRKETDTHRSELVQSISLQSELNTRSASLNAKIESLESRRSDLDKEKEEYGAKLSESDLQSRELVKKIQATKEYELKNKNEIEEKQRNLKSDQERLDQKENEMRDLRDELAEVRSRKKSLDELLQAHEGLGDGTRALLEKVQLQGNEGAFQAFADLFEVTPGFEKVLESFLGEKIGDLVSNDPQVVLSLLKEVIHEKKGRAAVHLTNVFSSGFQAAGNRPKELDQTLEGLHLEIEGSLDEFVSVRSDQEMGLMAKKMVSNVCVVKEIHSIPSESFSLQGWSIVDRKGVVLDSRGVLRGGGDSGDQSVSYLSRKREVQNLDQKLTQLQEAEESQLSEISELEQKIIELEGHLETLRVEQGRVAVEVSALEKDELQLKANEREWNNALSRVEEELKKTGFELKGATEEVDRIRPQLSQTVERREVLEKEISLGDEKLSKKLEQLRGSEKEFQEHKIEEASSLERIQSLHREIQSLENIIRDKTRRVNEIQLSLDRMKADQNTHHSGDDQLNEEIERLTKQLSELKEELSQKRDSLELKIQKIDENHVKIKQMHKERDEKYARSSEVVIESEKNSGELSHLKQNLEEKYGPGCLDKVSDSSHEGPTQMTLEEETLLFEEVERLRERIRRLGEVNPMALEEFEELKVRHDALVLEKEDLEKSIENLKEAIEHINQTSEDRFKKAFEAISNRFERLFPVIFGGGQARISLIYPEGSNDILDAGVDILAQPPGKKIVNINVLSGGEKALTAVALIFSIFMVKPSPFCVLDEVDAPLDDSNIGRFNTLLQQMAVKTQFIIITHNKKTMELNDTLYGVTMEEPGVSKMVSIEMH